MDLVVWLAIGTLLAVFLLAASVLAALLWRRHQQNKARQMAVGNFAFSRDNDKVENLVELVPLLDTELSKTTWADGQSEGPFYDVISILKLTTDIVKKLSAVSVFTATTKVYEVMAQSMFRVNTHFHELLEFTPDKAEDLRVIEARALTLTTTVWSLAAAFTIHGIDEAKEKEVEDGVIMMYKHVDSLRKHCAELFDEKKEGGEEGEEIKDDDENAASQSTEETTAGGDGGPEAVITHSDLPPPPNVTVAEVHTEEEDEEKRPLLNDENEEEEQSLAPSDPVPPVSPSKSDSVPIANGSRPKRSESANGMGEPDLEAGISTTEVVEDAPPLEAGDS